MTQNDESIRLRGGVLNMPSGVRKAKARLLHPSRRVEGALALADEHNLDFIVMPEAADPGVSEVVNRTEGWNYFKATENSRVGVRKIGNSLVYRDIFKMVDATNGTYKSGANIPDLHMPAVLLEHKETGLRFWVLLVHLPTKRGHSRKHRAALRRSLIEDAQNLYRHTGYPVVVAGDFNDRKGFGKFKRAARHGVDQVFALGHNIVVLGGRSLVKGVKGRLSDHPLVWGIFKLIGDEK